MKVLIAADSFKNCLTAEEVCAITESAFKAVFPTQTIRSFPLADGGEGTARMLCASMHGKMKLFDVHDPAGKKIKASAGILPDGDTAVADMASASGIELIRKENLNPLTASSYGTGELIRQLAETGVKRIILGLGGTATVDGGAGILQACGFRLKDSHGNDIEKGGAALLKLRKMESSPEADRLLEKVKFSILTDVRNPLTGPEGASEVFGPQKGASTESVKLLDAALSNFASVLKKASYADDCIHPGDGAAGGTAFAMRNVFKAEISSGADFVMEQSGLKGDLKTASFAITGEGRTDSQTASGKLCQAMAAECKRQNVPLILISGSIEGADTRWLQNNFAAWFSISEGPTSLETALAQAKDKLYRTALSAASLIKHAHPKELL